MMREEFLHYIWKFKRFDKSGLATTAGEPIKVISSGSTNSHAGPDFLNGQIQIGTTRWAGNIEIHVRASEWLLHMHQLDRSYDNVILHVVYENDRDVTRSDGSVIPCLELKDRINMQLYDNYKYLLHNQNWIPCEQQIGGVDEFLIQHWLERMLIERLQEKTEVITATLALNKNNWEETFYQLLARYFGMKVNSTPFELLARSVPSNILAKHKNNLLQLEALIFGQAGLLEDLFSDPYPKKLQKEYDFLRKKYNLHPIGKHLWKFLRLRPVNFPTIRLAQFASLIHRSSHLFSKTLAAASPREIYILFDAEVSEYWLTHYTFDKPSKSASKSLGTSAIDLLMINVIVPFLFIYGKQRSQPQLEERALSLLQDLAPEKNKITKHWEQIGIKPLNAYDSQALLQLYNNYCDLRKCLQCNIGNNILKRDQ